MIGLLCRDRVKLRSYNCQQKLVLSKNAVSGTFKLQLFDKVTEAINYNDNMQTIQEKLSSVGVETLVQSPYLITFKCEYAGKDLPKFLVVDNGLLDNENKAVSITVVFTARGRDNVGAYITGVPTDEYIYCNIQPMPKEYRLNNESDRLREAYEIFTHSPITEGQIVIKDNKEFEINMIEKWYNYYTAMLLSRKPV